jgi:hypothetical protein
MSEPAFVTKAQSALLCDRSEATIQRYKRQGDLPNSRYAVDGTLEIAVADLVAAGLLDPLAAGERVDAAVARHSATRELAQLHQDLAVLQASFDGVSARLSDALDQISYRRSRVPKAVA